MAAALSPSTLQLIGDLRELPAAQARLAAVQPQISTLRQQAVQMSSFASLPQFQRQAQPFRASATTLTNAANQLEATIGNDLALVSRIQSANPDIVQLAQLVIQQSGSGPRFT